MAAYTHTTLHICVTCRLTARDNENRCAGQELYNAVMLRLRAFTAPIDVRPVTCLANCERGCGAAISGEGKWSYLLGRLTPELASDLLVYATAYSMSSTGTVMPSRRPASLSQIILGRVPPLEFLPEALQ